MPRFRRHRRCCCPGTVDVRKNFTITPAPRRDGLDWVLVEPPGREADFRRALLGFEGKEAGSRRSNA